MEQYLYRRLCIFSQVVSYIDVRMTDSSLNSSRLKFNNDLENYVDKLYQSCSLFLKFKSLAQQQQY